MNKTKMEYYYKPDSKTLRLDELDYTIIPNSDIKPLLDKLQQENKQLKIQVSSREEVANKYKEVIEEAINNSQYWIDYYTRLNSDERIALRLQENIDILKEVSE